eukprot:711136-Pelagomonas_calceolata.AAC.1
MSEYEHAMDAGMALTQITHQLNQTVTHAWMDIQSCAYGWTYSHVHTSGHMTDTDRAFKAQHPNCLAGMHRGKTKLST